MREFKTKAQADAAFDDCKKQGLPCERVHGVLRDTSTVANSEAVVAREKLVLKDIGLQAR
jgi:hypothetical protein